MDETAARPGGAASRRGPKQGRPLGSRAQRRERNARILAEFDGENHKHLAAKWGMSVRTVYRIVSGR